MVPPIHSSASGMDRQSSFVTGTWMTGSRRIFLRLLGVRIWARWSHRMICSWSRSRIRRGWGHKCSLHHYMGQREGEKRWWVEPPRWRPCPRTTTNQFQDWMTKNSVSVLSRKSVTPSHSGTTKFVCCVGYILLQTHPHQGTLGCHVCSSEDGTGVQTHFHSTLNVTQPQQHVERYTVACKSTRQTDWQESITSGFWLCCGGGGVYKEIDSEMGLFHPFLHTP